ncbi:unnamed protein product [Candidula unifasciata]|uniref:RING-type domain-containing protein n=1 Tax=Candidula unifasciata TaxID=100452 RepID=A0A8S4A4B4_9EUPU|nr:unnamed protein product [Candidula unifasciata]
MWLKCCLLLMYILLLFVLSRILEAISWCESSYSGALSRHLLDPMVLSVARLKALLEQRGVSYDNVVEKSELTNLVETSGHVSAEEVEMSQVDQTTSSETNFTSGAHFIEQVEDAKDSVWLVQVVSDNRKFRIMSSRGWRAIREKASRFGIRTGYLDCSLDVRYCRQKGWRSPFLLLALPSQFEKKASVTMYNYSGSVKETAVFQWVRDKLDERILRITNATLFHQEWQDFSKSSLDPEVRMVLFTKLNSAPLFYSALSVKFPGRVKFGLVSLKTDDTFNTFWKHILGKEQFSEIPTYVTYTVEKNYTYGLRPGELYTFLSMEQFLKFLYPCLNDIFIVSFCVANFLSWFELFTSNCSILRRFRKFIWCMFKYNIAVIMLWLPVIGIFQMPYLDRVPLAALKIARILSTSQIGIILRGDCQFFLSHPFYILVSFTLYLILVTYLCKKYTPVEQDEETWFNFSFMRTHAYLRPNDIFQPMGMSGYDLLGGLDVFASRISQTSLWLHPTISLDYIKHLPTWRYCPVPLSERAAGNSGKVEVAMNTASGTVGLTSVSSRKELFKPEQKYSGDRQSEQVNSSEKCSSAVGNVDGQTVCSCIQASCNINIQAAHGGHHSCKCFHNDNSSDLTAGSLSKQSLDTATCTAPANTSAAVQDHPCLHTRGHHSESSDLPRAPCTSTHSSKPKTCDIIHDIKNSIASESLQTSSACSGATTLATDKDVVPTSSNSSVGNGFPSGYLESLQCVICLDEYAPLTMLCGLPCGHVFHESCIISWLNREKHFCPMCRWPSYKLHPNHI